MYSPTKKKKMQNQNDIPATLGYSCGVPKFRRKIYIYIYIYIQQTRSPWDEFSRCIFLPKYGTTHGENGGFEKYLIRDIFIDAGSARRFHRHPRDTKKITLERRPTRNAILQSTWHVPLVHTPRNRAAMPQRKGEETTGKWITVGVPHPQ